MKSPSIDDAALRRLLEEHRLCSAEIDRLTKMKPKLEAERDQIVRGSDVTLPAVFSKCSDLQLRLDLIATKLRQLEARIGEINTEFRPAFDGAKHSLSSAIQSVYDDAKSAAESVLSRLLSDPIERARVAERCIEPRRILSLDFGGGYGWSSDEDPFPSAQRLAECVDAFRAATK